MKTFSVAGHVFEDRVDAVCIKKLHSGDECRKPWWFVAEATDADVGKPDKAHEPHLTANELAEIREEIKRRDEQRERAYAAVMDLSKR